MTRRFEYKWIVAMVSVFGLFIGNERASPRYEPRRTDLVHGALAA